MPNTSVRTTRQPCTARSFDSPPHPFPPAGDNRGPGDEFPGAIQPRRLAGLRRVRNSPLETRCPTRVSTKNNFKARRARRAIPLRPFGRSWKTNLLVGFPNRSRTSGAASGESRMKYTRKAKTLEAFLMSAPGAQTKRTKVKLISPCGGRGNQKGIPPSADGGQPARLDRAGPQARTRLSPAGGTREFFRFTAKTP